MVREKEDLEGTSSKICKSVPEKVKVCVKKWISRCGMHEQKPHLENCCKSRRCCVLEASKSLIVHLCRGCDQKAREAADIVHDPKAPVNVIRICQASGTAPHGGEPIK